MMPQVSSRVDPEKMFDAYRERLVRRRVSEATLREYRLTTDRFMAWLKEQKLALEEIRRTHIEDFFGDTGWAPITQRNRVTWIRAAWKYAVHELETLDRSPFDGMRVELEKVPDREAKTISNEALRQIKAGVKTDSNWILYHLLVYTGMRIGEIRNLKWTDLSFKEQTIHIIGKGNKERTIPMHPALQVVLAAVPMFGRGEAGGSAPYVLPGRFGGQLTHGGGWKKTKSMAGDRDVAPHDFRRSFSTSLQENEAMPAAVKKILGHGPGGDVTLRHYTNLSQKVLYREICKVYSDDPL